jgi:hypothetical protein
MEQCMSERTQTQSLGDRLALEAKRWRDQARLLPPGAVRQAALQKARQAENAWQINAWITSPGLRAPI